MISKGCVQYFEEKHILWINWKFCKHNLVIQPVFMQTFSDTQHFNRPHPHGSLPISQKIQSTFCTFYLDSIRAYPASWDTTTYAQHWLWTMIEQWHFIPISYSDGDFKFTVIDSVLDGVADVLMLFMFFSSITYATEKPANQSHYIPDLGYFKIIKSVPVRLFSVQIRWLESGPIPLIKSTFVRSWLISPTCCQ